MTTGWDFDISGDRREKRRRTPGHRPNSAGTSDRSDVNSKAPSEDLCESAVEATALLANGFLAGNDDLGGDDAERIRGASVRYLYRLLCLLYAGSEEMDALARRVAGELDISDPDFRASETDLWDRLGDLFERVGAGRAAGREETLPAYDGALFETDPSADETAAFLQTHDVSDPYLARAVDALARREHPDRRNKEFVDYAALPVDSLGSVYEGLLDQKLEIEADEARLTTDADGRAATGAYYTPEPLVDYAVERTLEPLLAEIRADIDWSDSEAARRFAREVRNLDVVDPAMGCGRFLLAAVEYLADAIAAARRGRDEGAEPDVDPMTEMSDAPHGVRRRVAEECVYGVDADAPAVEVARASLWLEAIPAAEAPSLDHLKHGDSLVGASVGDIVDFAGREDVAAGRRTPPTPRSRLTATANVRTAERLGLETPSGAVRRTRRAANDPRAWREIRREEWFREAQSVADERDFFHWPLEFPGVFSGAAVEGRSGASAGFDAVIGNPPYVRSRELSADRKDYCRSAYRTAEGAADLYVPFVELAGELANGLGGRVSLVVPNKWTTTAYGRPLRDLLLDEYRLREILDASTLDAFPDADVYPVVVTFESGSPSDADDLRIRHPTEDRPLSAASSTAIPRSLVEHLGGRVVPLEMDLAFATVVADALADCDRLGDHVEMSEGIHTGNVRGKLLADASGADAPDADAPGEYESGFRRKLVDGGSIDRYRIDWDGSWIRHDESLVDRDRGEYADLRSPDLFEDEKLLVRDVSDRPVAAHDDEGFYALNTLYSVRSRADSDLSLRYLLGVFNAAFAARYFRQVCGGTSVAGGYLRFKPMFVADLPVPDPDPDAVEPAAVAAAAGVEREVPDDPEAAVATLTERLRAAADECAKLDTDPLEHLGDDPTGPSLGEWGHPVAGVRDSVLAETATDREGLRVGEVEVSRNDGTLSLSATGRYKPKTDDSKETDSWGFAETESVPALRFPDLGPTKARLAEAFVPAAVERGEGFAGFRANATKTISPLDRLRALTLPDPEAAADDLRRYREVRERAERLDARIAAMEDALDGIVYRLYGLDEGEIAAVEDAD